MACKDQPKPISAVLLLLSLCTILNSVCTTALKIVNHVPLLAKQVKCWLAISIIWVVLLWATANPAHAGPYVNPANEFPVCTNSSNQLLLHIYGDVVVWTDDRNGNYDIYAKNISTAQEFPICTNPADQYTSAIYGDTVVWEDHRSGIGDIYGKSLSGSEFPVCISSADQYTPAIYADVVVWGDSRGGNWDIYGKNLSTGPEFPICTNAANQYFPSIYGNIVVWKDYRNGEWENPDIYGKNLSTGEEFPVCTNPAAQEFPVIHSNIVVWEDNRNGNQDIYGKNLSTNEEFSVCTMAGDQERPTVYGDIIVWADRRNGNWDIYGKRISTNEEFSICINTADQRWPSIYDNTVIWLDNRNGNWDIYGNKILGPPEPQIEILLPHDNGEFYSGGSMRVEAKLSGLLSGSSVSFKGEVDPGPAGAALTFEKFSDDGKTLGDTTAGDGIYTSEIGLPKLTTGTHTLQVTAYVTTPTGTKNVTDSVAFLIAGRPAGAPTVKLDVVPQQGEIIYVGVPVTLTAQVNYPESGISPEKVYVVVYSIDGKELYRFDLQKVGEVYTKIYYFNQSGSYKVDAIAEAPLGSGYAKASDSQDLNVCIDRLKVSLRIEPESPSGIYLSNQDVNLIATVTTERGLAVPPRINVEGQIDLPNGEIRKIWFKNESWTSSAMITIHRPFILETTGNYSVSVYASAPNYATKLGAGLLFEVTEGLPAKLSDELKRIYGPTREAERLLFLMRDEGEAVAEDGDFLYVEKQEKQLRTYLDICYGLLDASLPDFGSKKLFTKWIEEWATSGVLTVSQEVWVQATLSYWQLVGTQTGFLKNLYDEYEKQKFVSTSDNIIEAIEDLDNSLYPMQRSTEEFYINDFRRRMAANWFLYGRGMCKYDIVHRLRDEFDCPWNPLPDLAVDIFVAALVVYPPTTIIGIAGGLLQTANDSQQDWSDMKKAERGFTLAFEGVCAIHTEAKAVEDNLVDFTSQVKTYDQTAPQGKITIVDATPDIPGSQEFMTGKLFTEWLLFIPVESYCIRTSWARLIIKNTGLTAAAFSVNATFSDTDFISQLAWLMRDKTTGTDCSSVFLAPGEERVVDLYFLNLASNPIFNYFPDHHSEVLNMAGRFYTNTKVPINYCLLATRKGNDLHIVDEMQDIYDPIEQSDETSKNISASLLEMTLEPSSFFEQQSEPNSYRMVEYPIWNTFTKRSIAKPYAYRDTITVSNPWPLALAVTVRQAINDRIAIQSIGDPGVVEVNEIVWQVELHPHETKTLTYDFTVLGAKVPQSGFITIPPAIMSIYDPLSDMEARFQSGNTRLRVWETMPADFDKDDSVNVADLSRFCVHWLEQDCNYPDWCRSTDLDYKGSVDFIDFAIFARNWGWTKILADIDADGDINLFDYAILANQWDEAPGFPSADVTPDNGDGIVDFWDLAMIAEYWLEGITP
jgi:beta propeller repeat protein